MTLSVKTTRYFLFFLLLCMVRLDCQENSITLITHSSFSFRRDLIAQFEKKYQATITIIKKGDAGEVLNTLILTKRVPIADIVYGMDINLLGKAIQAGILEKHSSSTIENIPIANYFPISIRQELSQPTIAQYFVPINIGYITFNYHHPYFLEHQIPIPKTIEDLLKPEYRGLIAIQNPATSTAGLCFFLATIEYFGSGNEVWKFWENLRKNSVVVTKGWSESYYIQFSYHGGRCPIVLSYSTSPIAEIYTNENDNSTYKLISQNLFLDGAVYPHVEGISLLKGIKNRKLAQHWIDFMLSEEVQTAISTTMWVYPIRGNIQLPPIFENVAIPDIQNIMIRQNPQKIKQWLSHWHKVVVQQIPASEIPLDDMPILPRKKKE